MLYSIAGASDDTVQSFFADGRIGFVCCQMGLQQSRIGDGDLFAADIAALRRLDVPASPIGQHLLQEGDVAHVDRAVAVAVAELVAVAHLRSSFTFKVSV